MVILYVAKSLVCKVLCIINSMAKSAIWGTIPRVTDSDIQRLRRVVLSTKIAHFTKPIANSIVELPYKSVTLSVAKTRLLFTLFCFHANLMNMTCNRQLQVYKRVQLHECNLVGITLYYYGMMLRLAGHSGGGRDLEHLVNALVRQNCL